MAEERSEPSMEEILSSIKRIIADDAQAPKSLARKSAAKPAMRAAAPEENKDDSEILELTENEEAKPAVSSDEQLIDDQRAADLARSFSALQTLSEPGVAPQIVRAGETSLEGLTRELLRPMLKDWLDQNLPQIVEGMVAREISRITKKN